MAEIWLDGLEIKITELFAIERRCAFPTKATNNHNTFFFSFASSSQKMIGLIIFEIKVFTGTKLSTAYYNSAKEKKHNEPDKDNLLKITCNQVSGGKY